MSTTDPSSDYKPPGLTEWELFNERCILVGMILAGVAYGILFTIVCLSYNAFFDRPKNKRSSWILYYTGLMFILATLGFAANTKFIEMTFVDYRNIPGGPNVFTIVFYANWVNMFAFVSYVLMSWLADGLVLYRFMLIYDMRLIFLPLPGLMYLAMIAMSICLAVSMMRPGTEMSFWSQSAVQFALAYWSLSVALNVSLTLLISGRLISMRRRVRKVMGNDHSTPYAFVVSMLIESAALYSVWVIVFIALYTTNSPAQHIIFPPLGQIQGIAPLLINFRVSQGKAWSRSKAGQNTEGEGTIPEFSSGDTTRNDTDLPATQVSINVNKTKDVARDRRLSSATTDPDRNLNLDDFDHPTTIAEGNQ
ncbi:hypothetical protein FA15DRAFT_672625 [Coprinopsis marcescibilis]|uniref:Uncharacterized protein n=1 Tax=Coprinopsis marcescibilis TaxID=230819 RepID=A0A5C3KNA6_COPMA|nr:hypothetical protein FA15DRAFT_672625 [Coprinopsis marcescibilis]